MRRIIVVLKIIFVIFTANCTGIKNICEVDPEQWRLDECGSNGYKSQVGDCIFEKSQKKPLFRKEKDVLQILGKPDTIFINEEIKHYYYVTIGPGFNGRCYNGGMLKTLQFFINNKGRITSVSGGIH